MKIIQFALIVLSLFTSLQGEEKIQIKYSRGVYNLCETKGEVKVLTSIKIEESNTFMRTTPRKDSDISIVEDINLKQHRLVFLEFTGYAKDYLCVFKKVDGEWQKIEAIELPLGACSNKELIKVDNKSGEIAVPHGVIKWKKDKKKFQFVKNDTEVVDEKKLQTVFKHNYPSKISRGTIKITFE